jgi:hypothetical protein
VARDSVWEIVFLVVILKIPVVYLCTVVYYAIKAEPRPNGASGRSPSLGSDDSGPGWSRRRRESRRPRPRPHGGPGRTYSRAPRTVHARAERR